jgi:hypothetical protein
MLFAAQATPIIFLSAAFVERYHTNKGSMLFVAQATPIIPPFSRDRPKGGRYKKLKNPGLKAKTKKL